MPTGEGAAVVFPSKTGMPWGESGDAEAKETSLKSQGFTVPRDMTNCDRQLDATAVGSILVLVKLSADRPRTSIPCQLLLGPHCSTELFDEPCSYPENKDGNEDGQPQISSG